MLRLPALSSLPPPALAGRLQGRHGRGERAKACCDENQRGCSSENRCARTPLSPALGTKTIAKQTAAGERGWGEGAEGSRAAPSPPTPLPRPSWHCKRPSPEGRGRGEAQQFPKLCDASISPSPRCFSSAQACAMTYFPTQTPFRGGVRWVT
jgi:hypothetical protein